MSRRLPRQVLADALELPIALPAEQARDRWRNGILAVFPPGIYWLQRFASVPVLET
jgi:hypothetical protein